MRSKKFIAANWKMNKTTAQSNEFVLDCIFEIQNLKCDALICPTFLSIPTIIDKCHSMGVYVGAQNCHWENSGAFTGEIAAPMLADIGVDYVILGHSERRTYFGETDEIIAKKVDNALKNKLKIILCVGETQEWRDCGEASQTVINQVKAAFDGVQKNDIKNVIIAYEPVWAIGTGKTIVPLDADKMCDEIKTFVTSKYGSECTQDLRVLYGGSINSQNAKSFLDLPNIDGALVGGASLEAKEFLKIIDIAEDYQT